MSNRAAYEEAYAKLRDSYINRLQSDVEEILNFIDAVKAGPVSKDEIIHIQNLCHGLAGTGGAFGFSLVTDCGRQAETCLEKIITGQRDKNSFSLAGDQTEIHTLLNNLYLACRAAIEQRSEAPSLSNLQIEDKNYLEGKKNIFVLVVDDDTNLRQMIMMRLEQRGFIVGGVGSDQDMIKSMAKRSPDLIILDINLPDNHGHEILRRLKSTRSTANIPVLMLTASSKEADVVSALHAGAVSYIIKPVDINKLSQRVEKICKHMRRTILIADNDQLILTMLNEQFQAQGFNVILVDNGLGALEKIKFQNPDLVILDVSMPGMDGISVLKMLRKDKTAENIPVIILSALADQRDKETGMDSGASDYITKPFNVHDLINRSRMLLDGNQS